MNWQPDDRFVHKQSRNEFRFLRVEPDGKVALRTQFGGTELVRPEELTAFYEALQWRLPTSRVGGRTVAVGDRFAKAGETFVVHRIDAPATNRVVLRGDRGQIACVEPIEELFVYYVPVKK